MDLGSIGFGSGLDLGLSTSSVDDRPLYLLPQDVQEARSIAPTIGGDGGLPWWEKVAAYGLTRAIDNQFGPPPGLAGNISPGSFAGQNGQTYAQTAIPQPLRAGVFAGADAQSGGLMGLLLCVGLVFVVMNAD